MAGQDFEKLFKEFQASTDRDQLLLRIAHFTAQSAGAILPGGIATEPTLQAVLTAIQLQKDFETKLVRDTGNGDKIVQERISYDPGTSIYTYSYTDVGGSVYVPVGPLEYLDPESVLNLLLSSIAATIGIDDSAHGANQQGQRALGTDGTKDQQIKTNVNGELQVDVLSVPATTYTHNPIITSGSGNVPIGARRGSVLNIGGTAGIWGGVSLPPGVGIPFGGSGLNGTLSAAITYNATGTTFVIEYDI